jgi:hypothetical protein
LAEEITQPDENNHVIGAGCPGTGFARCTFNEFCEYIWKGKPTESVTRPTVTVLAPGEVFEDISISQLYNRIVAWRDPVTGSGITGATDSSRVVLGSTDYYDALRKVAGPIGDLANTLSTTGIADADSTKIVNNGKVAAQLLHDMRMQDLEKFRLKAIAQKVGVLVSDLRVKLGRNTLGVPGQWYTLDAPKTITKLQALQGGVAPQVRSDLYAAITEWQTGSQAARGHWAAVCSADSAQRLAGC